MRVENGEVQLSASDLVGYLNCQHLTALDLNVVRGVLEKPVRWDPLLEILRERGRRHEAAFVEHLREQGFDADEIEGVEITPESVARTRDVMAKGKDIIIQAALQHGCWSGRADILKRVEKPSNLGDWSYEVIDTKLARETKGGTVLQLCLYADLLARAQGVMPDNVYVVAPWSNYEPKEFRVADYAAYFRRAKQSVEIAVNTSDGQDSYPDPKEHCDVCRWNSQCEKRRRDDDHLCLVAGITKIQINELQANQITTTTALASMPTPMAWKPQRGSPVSFEKIREQARIQIESRGNVVPSYELLPVIPNTGFCLLPEPSKGDIFFDIEGDPFVGEHGLEYLFGYQYHGDDGEVVYTADWAFDRTSEKAIFERFVDFVIARRAAYPDMHIYHFAPYEPGALKRLMGRYASRENEIDDLLRGRVLVDLYSVVRNGIRAGVESYSIKKLEPLYAFKRKTPLSVANIALTSVQAGLELGDASSISEEDRQVVQDYNEDDCASTLVLRHWLEARRNGLVSEGTAVPRPEPGTEASEELNERLEQVKVLIDSLTADVPVDPEQRTQEQQARWILAYLLEWHRREDKATWWEYFRLSGLTADELIDERAALAKLTFFETVHQSKTGIPTHRYRFEQQDTDLRGDEEIRAVGGEKIGATVAISTEDRTIDIKKQKATADIHPDAVFAHTIFNSKEQAGALFRIAEYVSENGIEGDGDYLAARALLLKKAPQTGGLSLRGEGEPTLEAALRIADSLDGGIFPIQGPPGTGKSYTGARMICRLVRQGRKVGITANSHKVIRNLIDKVLEAAGEMGINLRCVQKPKEMEPDQERLIFAKDNAVLLSALAHNQCQVAGGTHYLWTRADAHDVLDVLVVDEAAQMSLANVVAAAQSARTLILLGDPQQLDQPTQGTHPDGTGVSSLEHILGQDHTIAADRGLFIENTWRMHPEICVFNSELFYDGKLFPQEGCERQHVRSQGVINGSGLRYLAVPHTGNQNASVEEAEAIAKLIQNIMASDSYWTDRNGAERSIELEDIVIITPYNAQVFEIQQRIPGGRVGTVDKFQGQEAPIAIYSVATSSYADAPRGMEFLYSANRFNVAVSRARCIAILVASPQVFEAECKTPRQMQLANAFCRYLEVADSIEI